MSVLLNVGQHRNLYASASLTFTTPASSSTAAEQSWEITDISEVSPMVDIARADIATQLGGITRTRFQPATKAAFGFKIKTKACSLPLARIMELAATPTDITQAAVSGLALISIPSAQIVDGQTYFFGPRGIRVLNPGLDAEFFYVQVGSQVYNDKRFSPSGFGGSAPPYWQDYFDVDLSCGSITAKYVPGNTWPTNSITIAAVTAGTGGTLYYNAAVWKRHNAFSQVQFTTRAHIRLKDQANADPRREYVIPRAQFLVSSRGENTGEDVPEIEIELLAQDTITAWERG